MKSFPMRSAPLLALAILLTLGAGCVDVDVPALGPKVLTLSKALTPPNRSLNRKLDPQEFLEKACEKDTDLLKPFADCKLKVQRGSLYVGLLVCDEVGRQAYYEDLSCTSGMEKNHSKISPYPPCEFTLNPDVDCPKPKTNFY